MKSVTCLRLMVCDVVWTWSIPPLTEAHDPHLTVLLWGDSWEPAGNKSSGVRTLGLAYPWSAPISLCFLAATRWAAYSTTPSVRLLCLTTDLDAPGQPTKTHASDGKGTKWSSLLQLLLLGILCHQRRVLLTSKWQHSGVVANPPSRI